MRAELHIRPHTKAEIQMKKITLLTLSLLLTALVQLTTQPVQAEVSIPDENLAVAIREALGLPTDAVITADAMLDLTGLGASGKEITALTGLEHATNLTWLNLGKAWVDGQWHTNPISDVSPLAALTQLTTLRLGSTAVSDVSPLASLTQLRVLTLWDTAISDVSPLANLTQLTRLELVGTAVSDVSPLANLTQLTSLRLDGTAVSDVSPLAALTQLTWLSLSSTAVSDVSPLANLTQLTSLDLGFTRVSDVSPLANLTQLTHLELVYTAVSDVSPLANLTQLETLYLQNCLLNADAYQTHIPAIQANGTEVGFDPFKPIHLPRGPWLVSLIYFRPSDRPVRPNVDAEIDALIKKAQRFFADQLERHGFGRKTFQFETDAHGNAVVHHINGKFPNVHYQQNSDSWEDEIGEQIYIPLRSITVHMLDSDPDGRSFTGAAGTGGPISYGGSANIDSWHWKTIAHELAHACGLQHDWRADANAKRIKTFTDDPMLTSFCAAEWLSVHPAFNPGQPVSTSEATIKMLPPTLASPPNTIRLRFEVTDRDGLHQAQLRIRDFGHDIQYGALIDCKRLNGRHSTVEFLTTALTPQIERVTLSVIDVRGHRSQHTFDIDVSSLLPPAKVVSIPDPNLAAAVREELNMSAGETLTTRSILNLVGLDARNRGIKDLTGLEHAANLKEVDLGGENTSSVEYVNSNAISDFSPLEKLTDLVKLSLNGMSGLRDVSALASLTNLDTLYLNDTDVSDVSALVSLTDLDTLQLWRTGVSDVSALASLTNLYSLYLNDTAVSDVSALTSLTNLEFLNFYDTSVSDVSPLLGLSLSSGMDLKSCPLSYASIHTHIPALEAKGIEVRFDNVAHPALLKVSGDRQEGEPGAMLKTAFVVEAMDEQGEPIVGRIVEFDILGGGGSLSAETVETDAQGKARVTLTLGSSQGVNKVKASSAGIRSWVLFTAVGAEEVPQLVADVNGDGVVNIQDLVLVAGLFGKTGEHGADVNGDGVVNIQDLVLVAGAFGEGAAAPSARAVSLSRLTVSDVEGWLIEARVSIRSGSGDPELQRGSASRPGGLSYSRGIAILERLLASLMPKATALLANYPNPFNPETWIPYQLANPAEVTVTIYAANGAVVRKLDLGHQRAGSYASRHRAAYWDGRNAHGEPVASGVYFYTLSTGDFSGTRKMVIRK